MLRTMKRSLFLFFFVCVCNSTPLCLLPFLRPVPASLLVSHYATLHACAYGYKSTSALMQTYVQRSAFFFFSVTIWKPNRLPRRSLAAAEDKSIYHIAVHGRRSLSRARWANTQCCTTSTRCCVFFSMTAAASQANFSSSTST